MVAVVEKALRNEIDADESCSRRGQAGVAPEERES
jgi:hypothetical protein